jgi:hypothetical protein
MKKITFKALVREEIRKVLKEENPSVDVQDFDAIEANVAAALPELETLIKNQIGATIKLKVEQLRSKPTLSL